MCRGCLFVIVDIPSGGDIDGCCKMEILEEIGSGFPDNPIIKKKLEEMEKDLDEENCFVGFWQPKPQNEEEFKKQAAEWLECRTKIIHNYMCETLKMLIQI